MKTIKLAMVSAALLAAVSAASFAQGVARGGGGGGGGGAGGGAAGGGSPRGGGGGVGRGAAGGGVVGGLPRALSGYFVGTSVASDSLVMAMVVKISAKYAADIQAGRVTRAGPPADSLVEKAKVATSKRNDEFKALLKSDDDKKKFDENVVTMTTGRGGVS